MLLIAASTLNAQSSLRTGLELGLSTSFYGDYTTWSVGETTFWNKDSPVIGPVVGLSYQLDIAKRWGLIGSLQYQKTGFSTEYGNKTEIESTFKSPATEEYFIRKQSLTLHKLALPLGIGYHWVDQPGLRLSTHIGLRVNYNFHSRYRTYEEQSGELFGNQTLVTKEEYNPLSEDDTYVKMRSLATQFFLQHSLIVEDDYMLTARVNVGRSLDWNSDGSYGYGCWGPGYYYLQSFNHADFTLSFTWLFD